MAHRWRERIISIFYVIANTDVSIARTNKFISMIVFFFRWHIPSIHPCKRDTALYRHRPGRRLEKDIFVQLRIIYLSQPDPIVPGARIRDVPAAPRLPEILRGRRPAPQLRPCRRGARRHPARRRPPHPHAGEPSRRRALRAGAPKRAPQPQGPRLSTRRSGASSSTCRMSAAAMPRGRSSEASPKSLTIAKPSPR